MAVAKTDPVPDRPTFYKDVLPILQARCQSCHRKGEAAPMPLMLYAEVRPWAKAIKDAVATRRMPPWFADPRYGCFSNDPRLSPEEVAVVTRWASQGAAEGNAKDAPPRVEFANGWAITPDLIVTLPKPVPLAASGLINYKYVLVRTNFPTDVWLSASEMRAGNRKALHHGKVWVRPPGSRWMANAVPGEAYEYESDRDHIGRNLMADNNEIAGKFNPGLGVQRYDVGGAGVFIAKGSDLVFEMHYTSTGSPTTDQSSIGLVFAKQKPALRYHYSIRLATPGMRIPPRASNYEVLSELTVEAPAQLAYIQPHMHLRGKDYELRIIHPNGAQETVFQGKYDFNWQLGYTFTKPIPLAAGTRLVGIAHFDNSANNPANPDPSQEVRWGPQNRDEMANGFLGLLVDVRVPTATLLRRTGPSAPSLLSWLIQTFGGGPEQ